MGFVELFAMPDTYKLYPKDTVTKGYKDLVIEGVMNPESAALIVLKWNGTEYEPGTCWTKENIGQGKPVWKTTQLSCPDDPLKLTKPSRQLSPPQSPAPQNPRIVPPAFTIPAGGYSFYPFVIRKNGVLFGRFQATGGGGNDVEVFVLGQDEFTNWKNGHSVDTSYNSGRITVSNISVELSSGSYFLVFSNTFSVVTPKAVTANIFLRPR